MRASEWQFLCAVHEQPKSCCAIDYCCHTLDWAANVVTDQKLFPSRFVVLNDAQSKNVGLKNLINVFRRLHRIFAHAWFQHRSVFWSVEGQTGLYVFFKTVCDLYDLLPAENYKLPPEAEGLEAPPPEPEPEKPLPQILKPPSQQRSANVEEDSSHHGVGRTNTRRHIRSSPSTGSAVTTVIEADEDDTDGVMKKVKELQISTPETVDEEPEVAEVPVIVEHSIASEAPSASEAEQSESSDADQTVIEIEPVQPEPDDDDEKPSSEEPAPTSGEEETDNTSTKPDVVAETPDSQPPAATDEPSPKAEDSVVEKEEAVETTTDTDAKAEPDTNTKDE
jgi:hypothetical protein